MRLHINKWGLDIKLSDEVPTTVVVEKTDVYADICNNVWQQSMGMDGNVILSDKNNSIKFNKSVAVIFNPFAVSCNDKKILSRLYKEMDEVAQEIYYEETNDLLSKVINYLDLISMKMPYPVTFNDEINIEGIYKLFEVSVEDESTNLLEKLTNYIKMMHRLAMINVVITVGLKRYLSLEELEAFYKEILYEKIYFFNIENCYDCKVGNEQVIIVDKDLCKIDLD